MNIFGFTVDAIRRRPLACFSALAVLLMLFFSSVIPDRNVDAYLTGEQVRVSGYVLQKYGSGEEGKILILTPESRLRILCSISGTMPRIGQYVTVEGTLEKPLPARNPGGFDGEKYYRSRRIHLLMYGAEIRAQGESYILPLEMLSRWKLRMTEALFKNYSEETAGVLTALLFGEKGELDEEVRRVYRQCGILHILALSGLHVSVISRLIERILGPFVKKKSHIDLIGLAFVWLWCIMAGCPVSMLRAAYTAVFRVAASRKGMDYDAMTGLMLSALLLMLQNPYALSGSGMQFSYCAVLGITLIKPLVPKALGPVAMQLSTGASTLPVALSTYYCTGLYQLPVNLLVLPVVGWMLAGGLLVSILDIAGRGYAASVLTEGIAFLTELPVQYTIRLCKAAAGLPGGVIITGAPGFGRVAVYVIVLASGVLFIDYRKSRGKDLTREKHYLPLFCLVYLSLQLILCIPSQREAVVFADVGQGDCILILGREGDYMVDCGSSSYEDVWSGRVEPSLMYYGVSRLTKVFLTHADTDHVSGVREALSQEYPFVTIESLCLPDLEDTGSAYADLIALARDRGTDIDTIAMGGVLWDGENTIYCLSPARGDGKVSNENSLVLYVRGAEADILLTGDIDTETEGEILSNFDLGRLRAGRRLILKVAHHGSRYSTSSEFLEAIGRAEAVISVGYNTYGHPHADTLLRLREAGFTVQTTRESGAIVIESNFLREGE